MEKILIIDDDRKFRKEYKGRFKSLGFGVLEAPDALEVVNLLMREHKNIALIILDINIPEVDGRGIYEIIQEYAPEIPVVVSSVFPISNQKLKIQRARGYHNKINGKDVLIKKVKEILTSGISGVR